MGGKGIERKTNER